MSDKKLRHSGKGTGHRYLYKEIAYHKEIRQLSSDNTDQAMELRQLQIMPQANLLNQASGNSTTTTYLPLSTNYNDIRVFHE